MISAAIVTVSDRCFNERQEDLSGPAIREALPGTEFEVRDQTIVLDEEDRIAGELIRMSDQVGCDVIFTTGGTGLGPRDVTPEATAAVCTRLIPGISEAFNAVAQVRGYSLILG